jgi:hypothetical protein
VSVGLARLMVRTNDNVSACNNMSTRGLLCQWDWLDWWFVLMIMCPRGITCLPGGCCVSGVG